MGRFLSTRNGQCAVCVLTAFVLVFGFFFTRTFLSPPTPHFDLNFGAARWIEPLKSAPIVYFRKDVYLTGAADQAWIQIGATDSFELYVNGAIVATNEFDATNTSGVFDLKTLLHGGHNAIGVLVSRTIYPGPSRLMARLSIQTSGEPVRDVLTDETWRESPNLGLVPSDIHWSSPEFDATAWPRSKFAETFDPHVNQVDLDPRTLATPPEGQWLTSPIPTAREQGFVANFNLADTRSDAWLQIAATGDYQLIINGTLRALETLDSPTIKAAPFVRVGQSGVAQAALPPPSQTTSPGSTNASSQSTSAPNSPPSTTSVIQSTLAGLPEGDQVVPILPQAVSGMPLQIYSITPWLRSGANEIVIRIRATQGPVAMLADGFTLQTNGEVRRFTSDSIWRAVTLWAGRRPLKTEHAVTVGAYGRPPWGILPQVIATPLTVPLYDSESIARWTFAYLAIFASVFGLSILCSYFVARLKGVSFQETLLRDAMLHAPAFCAALFLWLVSYDYRLPVNIAFQPKFIAGLVIVLFAARIQHFFPLQRVIPSPISWPRFVKIALLAGIVCAGFSLRIHDLTGMSLDHDEMTLIRKAHGVLDKGIPYSLIGSKERVLTTYELVSYVLAAAGTLLGWGEWAMRLPAVLFGTVNIVLLAWAGRRMFDWRAGWFAALIYAFLPVDIRWAQNAFYPAQTQFFSILTFWCFYEAIRTKPFHQNYLRVAALGFCASYLSWEGTGFILPVLFISLLTVRWGEYWWLKDWHLYRCLFWMTFVVGSQLCTRFLVNDAYLLVGIGLSTISSPSLFFLDSNFDPYYYLKKLTLSENHVFITITVCSGVFLFWRHAGIRYLFVVVAGLMACFTNLLPVYAPRYCLFYQPLFVLLGSAMVFQYWDYMNARARRIGGLFLLRLNHACMASFALLVFLSTNTWLLKAYRLCLESEVPGLNVRMGSYRVDYRGVANYVKEHMQPGDAVIPGIPHVYEYYSGNKGGYFLNSLLVQQITYETMTDAPFYRDKFVGNPVIRNLQELKEVIDRAPRTWVIQAPLQFAQMNQPNVLGYFAQYGRVVFESYNAKVILIKGASSGDQRASFQMPNEPGR